MTEYAVPEYRDELQSIMNSLKTIAEELTKLRKLKEDEVRRARGF